MGKKLSHVTDSGAAHMVDVSRKAASLRRAVVEGYVRMGAGTLRALKANAGPKGEVLGVARVAGILAAKRTGELIPLCHPLGVEQVTVEFEYVKGPRGGVRIVATAVIFGKTGVEMEAYTAVAVAGLTIIDMLKGIDQAMVMEGVRLLEKTGGKSDYRARGRKG